MNNQPTNQRQHKKTTDRVEEIMRLSPLFDSKRRMAEELSLSRPTLDSRLSGKTKWKLIERNWIKFLHRKIVTESKLENERNRQ